MALINCPECGKEMSDKVKKCPHCGFDMKKNKISEGLKKRLIVTSIIIVILGVFGFTVYRQFIRPNILYRQAVVLYDKGKYDEAEKIIDTIPEYKDSEKMHKDIIYQKALLAYNNSDYEIALELVKEIPEYDGIRFLEMQINYGKANMYLNNGDYENAKIIFEKIIDYEDVNIVLKEIEKEELALACIEALQQRLKNPSSLQIHEVRFNEMYSNETKKDEPVIMINYGGQNSFGGMTTSIVSYVSGEYLGNCDSLDISDVNKNDKDEVIGWIVASSNWDRDDTIKLNVDRLCKALGIK